MRPPVFNEVSDGGMDMGSMKKVLGAIALAGVLAAGGFAASVALAASQSSGFSAQNCSGGAQDAARAKTFTAIFAGNSAASAGSCSITIVGKFSTLPSKNVGVSSLFKMTAVPGTKGTYTGHIKTKTFTGTVTISPTNGTLTLPNTGGCGWTYAWIGGHLVAMFTTC